MALGGVQPRGPYLIKPMLEALIELLAPLLHILHFNTGVVTLCISGVVLHYILTIFYFMFILVQNDLVTQIIVRFWNSLN